MTPKEILAQAMADLGLVVESTFVPWSKSRNYKPGAGVKARTLNWSVTLKRRNDRGDLREVITTDYTAGIGHAPSYPKGGFGYGQGITLDVANALEYETEQGHAARQGSVMVIRGKTITVDACDVVASLVLDASAIDHPTFESWASDCGMDTDSRKAETIY